MKNGITSEIVLMLAMLLLCMGISAVQAQTGNVGINTETPQATLDVTGVPADASRMDGITAPRLTGAQLRAKTYTVAQDGAMVYVTAADPTPAGQTERVKYSGYFYFNSSEGSNGKWFPFKCCGPNGETIDGCGNVSSATTVTDVDGNVYETVTIGTQTWMASNLKATKYNDGTAIANITANTGANGWANSTTIAYCWYNNDEAANKCTYGALYNWYAVDMASNGNKNICPTAWHVPTDAEWTALETYLGSDEGSKLAGYANLWTDGVLETNADFNSSGFSAVPGGFRHNDDGLFVHLGNDSYWWSSSDTGSGNRAWSRNLNHNNSSVNRNYYNKSYGFSVRCIRN